MAFRRIKKTIEAFQHKPPPPIQDQLDLYEQGLRQKVYSENKAERPNLVVKIGGALVVILPLSYFMSGTLGAYFKFDEKITAIVISLILMWIATDLQDRILDIVPFHKLNLYFGSKIEATIAAFRSKRSASDNE